MATDRSAGTGLAGEPDVATVVGGAGEVGLEHGPLERVGDVDVAVDDDPPQVDVGRARQGDRVACVGEHPDGAHPLARLQAAQDARHRRHAGDVGDEQLPPHVRGSGVQTLRVEQPDLVTGEAVTRPRRTRSLVVQRDVEIDLDHAVDDPVVRDRVDPPDRRLGALGLRDLPVVADGRQHERMSLRGQQHAEVLVGHARERVVALDGDGDGDQMGAQDTAPADARGVDLHDVLTVGCSVRETLPSLAEPAHRDQVTPATTASGRSAGSLS